MKTKIRNILEKTRIDLMPLVVVDNEDLYIDIDNREKDTINIWMYELMPGTSMLDENVIIIPREHLNNLIEVLQKCKEATDE